MTNQVEGGWGRTDTTRLAQAAASPRPGHPSGQPYDPRQQSSAPNYPEPLQSLIEIGLLDRLAARTARVEDLSRAHPVWRVKLADGSRLVAKAGIGHGGPDLAIECLIYRMTNWCRPLAAVLPEALAVDEDRQLLVLADVGGAGAGSLAQQQPAWVLVGEPPATWGDVSIAESTSSAIGAAIGRIHRATVGFPLPPARPPLVLSLVSGAAGPKHSAGEPSQSDSQLAEQWERLGLPKLVQTTAGQLRNQAPIAAAARELGRPVAGCLVNHDLKWDNIVLSEAGTPVILDWELAGLGDPAWDLGCLLAEHLIRANAHAPLSQVGQRPDRSVAGGDAAPAHSTQATTADSTARSARATAIESPTQQLLHGYLEGARPRPEIVSMLARRVSLAAGLRVAQLALEVAYTPSGPDVTKVIDRLITRATEILSDQQLIAEVKSCLSSQPASPTWARPLAADLDPMPESCTRSA